MGWSILLLHNSVSHQENRMFIASAEDIASWYSTGVGLPLYYIFWLSVANIPILLFSGLYLSPNRISGFREKKHKVLPRQRRKKNSISFSRHCSHQFEPCVQYFYHHLAFLTAWSTVVASFISSKTGNKVSGLVQDILSLNINIIMLQRTLPTHRVLNLHISSSF